MKSKVLIVASNYYKEICKGLCDEAIKFLNKNDINTNVIYVPGTFEISFTINKIISKKNFYKGVIAIGCVIRGDTYHFELISNECARSINDIMLKSNIPIGFGVITCDNMHQAKDRSSPNRNNKGLEAASACLEMMKLSDIIDKDNK